MAKRCLIITYYFPPVGGGGVQRILKLIKYISKSGWQATVLTAGIDLASIPEDKSLESDLPETCNVIRIHDDRDNKSQSVFTKFRVAGFALRWTSAFFYIPDIRVKWLKPALSVALKEIKTNHFDCVLVSSPPYSLTTLAVNLQEKTDIPVILDMRDPWTTNPYKIHPTPIHKKIDQQIEKENIAKIKWGVSAYSSLINFYQQTISDFSKQNWQHIPNGYDEGDFSHLSKAGTEKSEFNLAFSGTFYSHINNPKNLFKAIKTLIKRYPEQANKIKFHHFGKSNINLQKLAQKHGIEDYVISHGYIDHHECLQELKRMSALCFILDETHQHSGMTIGGKVYEYLRLEKPILAMVPIDGEAAQLIRQTKSGVVVSSEDAEGIAEILNNWILNKPEISIKGIENYSRESQARQFLDLFDRALKG